MIGIALFSHFFDRDGEVNYSIFETLLIGLSCLLVPLQLWSLFLPSNQYFLGLALLGSLFAFVYKREFILRKFKSAWLYVKSFSYFQLFLMFLFVLITFKACLWIYGVFDAEFYHYQAIWWNEAYPVIPGLGNVEDRLGFNSSYFLLSSIFSLRFVIGEPVYGLQSFIFVAFILWGLAKLLNSENELEYVIFFVGLTLFSMLNLLALFATSTDILPNILFLYLVSLILFDNKVMGKKMLLYLLVPLLIITLKISLAPVVLFSFVVLYFLKRKGYSFSKMFLLSAILSLIPALWLIRNVIISGYLVYPIYELDLFAVDWKIPKEIAILQKEYIHDFPVSVWNERIKQPLVRYTTPAWYNLLALGTSVVFILLMPFIIYSIYKRIRNNFSVSYLIAVLITSISISIGILNGFDFRFICGAIIFFLVLGGVSFLRLLKLSSIKYGKYIVVLLFFLTYGIWVELYFNSMRKEVAQVSAVNKNVRKWNSILVSPYPTGDFMEAMGYANVEKEVNKEIVGGKFDFYIPQTLFVKDKYPYVYEVANVHHTKLTDYHCLEARGEKIEDGFRMNIDCVRENLYKVKNAMREEGY